MTEFPRIVWATVKATGERIKIAEMKNLMLADAEGNLWAALELSDITPEEPHDAE